MRDGARYPPSSRRGESEYRPARHFAFCEVSCRLNGLTITIIQRHPSRITKARPCVSTSPILVCSAMWSRREASRMARNARISRSPQRARASARWNRRSAPPCWCAGAAGVTPTQAGRTLLQHARTILGAGRAAARGPQRLCGRARRPGAGAVEHQRAHRIPARNAVLVSRRPSECQRRSGGAAVGRDRRTDRRGRRRHRHRRRHGRSRAARPPIRFAATVSCWWSRAIMRSRGAPRSASPRCSITTSSGSTARARCSASSPTRQAASAARSGCACSCAASMRCAGWSSAMSASASCRRRRCAGPPRRWRSSAVAAHRSVGAARPVDLRARLQGAAALCAAAGGSHAGGAAGDYVTILSSRGGPQGRARDP